MPAEPESKGWWWMPKTKPAEQTAPIVIPDNSFYTLEAARGTLGLRHNSVVREIRHGRLRCCKRSGRILIPGHFLREWIEAGEVKRRSREEAADRQT